MKNNSRDAISSPVRCVCRECGARYPVDSRRWRCDCTGPLDLDWRPRWPDGGLASQPHSMWRYGEALPLACEENRVTLGEFITPLLPLTIAGHAVLVKQEQLLPSGSFKDRGAALMVSAMKELGVRRAVQDSSGNAGAAVAAYCARAGIDCDIYVPAATSPEKLRQIRNYGASLILVPGDREAAATAARSAAEQFYYASHCWNPFFHHGVKTWSFEVYEQLGRRAPDAVILPAGNGSLLLGVHLGFKELLQLGRIAKSPRLIAVQSAACAPLHRFFNRAPDSKTGNQPTIAEGIAVAQPPRLRHMAAALREGGGEVLTVDDAEVAAAQQRMGRQGFCIEPTAAAAIAGVEACAATRRFTTGEIIVTLFTGHGLKSGK